MSDNLLTIPDFLRNQANLAEEVEQPCSCCKVAKPLSDFYKDKSRSNGYARTCKYCSRVNRNARRQQQLSKAGFVTFSVAVHRDDKRAVLEVVRRLNRRRGK